MRLSACRLLLPAVLATASAAGAAPVEISATSSDGKPLREAVVFLESPAAKAAAKPMSGTEIEQAERRFTRRVTVVTVGSEIQFPNRDKVRHHVYSFSPAKTFELKLYAGTPANPVLFDRAGIAVLGCNIHDTMVAWVVAVETPHHAITDTSGTVKLDVPPGSYKLRAWHPAMPPGAAATERALVVAAGGNPAVTVALPVTAAAAGP